MNGFSKSFNRKHDTLEKLHIKSNLNVDGNVIVSGNVIQQNQKSGRIPRGLGYQIWPQAFYHGSEMPEYGGNVNNTTVGHAGGLKNGDLAGINSKLDYLKDLGVEWIYVNPFMKSITYHGYDTIDYRAIDIRKGDFTQFDSLIANLHSKNMKFVLDYVPNHASPLCFDYFNHGHTSHPAPNSLMDIRRIGDMTYEQVKQRSNAGAAAVFNQLATWALIDENGNFTPGIIGLNGFEPIFNTNIVNTNNVVTNLCRISVDANGNNVATDLSTGNSAVLSPDVYIFSAFTTDGAYIDFNWKNPATLDWHVENMVWWANEHGIDGYRLDVSWDLDDTLVNSFEALTELKRRVLLSNPGVFMFGEVFYGNYDDNALVRQSLGCCVEYKLRDTFGGTGWDVVGVIPRTLPTLKNCVSNMNRYYNAVENIGRGIIQLSTHDVGYLRSIYQGGQGRVTVTTTLSDVESPSHGAAGVNMNTDASIIRIHWNQGTVQGYDAQKLSLWYFNNDRDVISELGTSWPAGLFTTGTNPDGTFYWDLYARQGSTTGNHRPGGIIVVTTSGIKLTGGADVLLTSLDDDLRNYYITGSVQQPPMTPELKSGLLALYLLQMTMPGTPCLYNGEELGSVGATGDMARSAIKWTNAGSNIETVPVSSDNMAVTDSVETQLADPLSMLNRIKAMNKARMSHLALTEGILIKDVDTVRYNLTTNGNTSYALFGRKFANNELTVCVNMGATPITLTVYGNSSSPQTDSWYDNPEILYPESLDMCANCGVNVTTQEYFVPNDEFSFPAGAFGGGQRISLTPPPGQSAVDVPGQDYFTVHFNIPFTAECVEMRMYDLNFSDFSSTLVKKFEPEPDLDEFGYVFRIPTNVYDGLTYFGFFNITYQYRGDGSTLGGGDYSFIRNGWDPITQECWVSDIHYRVTTCVLQSHSGVIIGETKYTDGGFLSQDITLSQNPFGGLVLPNV